MLLLGSCAAAKQGNQPGIAQLERRGQQQLLFDGIPRLTGLDGLPLHRRQAGQRGQLLEGPPVQITAVADKLPEEPGSELGIGAGGAEGG